MKNILVRDETNRSRRSITELGLRGVSPHGKILELLYANQLHFLTASK